MVVGVQSIRDAAEAAERLEAADDLGLDGIARTLEFLAAGTFLAEPVEFRIDDRFEFCRRVSLARRGLDAEHGTERESVLVRGHVLRDLQLVDELLVEATRLAAAEHACGKVGFRIARGEDR